MGQKALILALSLAAGLGIHAGETDPNHSVIHDPKADLCYVVYHRRPLTGNHRVICIDRMESEADTLLKKETRPPPVP